jgi:hypothetical protein
VLSVRDFPSTSLSVILALSTSITKVLVHLKIVSFTFVPASHLIFDTASSTVVSVVISKSSIFVTISLALSQAFSAGEPESGAIILNSHGLVISTYAPIQSYSQAKVSLNFFFSTGGK